MLSQHQAGNLEGCFRI